MRNAIRLSGALLVAFQTVLTLGCSGSPEQDDASSAAAIKSKGNAGDGGTGNSDDGGAAAGLDAYHFVSATFTEGEDAKAAFDSLPESAIIKGDWKLVGYSDKDEFVNAIQKPVGLLCGHDEGKPFACYLNAIVKSDDDHLKDEIKHVDVRGTLAEKVFDALPAKDPITGATSMKEKTLGKHLSCGAGLEKVCTVSEPILQSSTGLGEYIKRKHVAADLANNFLKTLSIK